MALALTAAIPRDSIGRTAGHGRSDGAYSLGAFLHTAIFFLFWFAQLLQPTPRKTSDNERSRGPDEIQREKLKSIWAGNGRASDGTILALDSYETGSGMRVAITRGKFNSPRAAREELNRWLTQATSIMEHGRRKGSPNQQDCRALGIFHSAKAGEEYYAVLWTDSANFYWVSSPSLELLLQVEKELNAHTFHERLESMN